MCSRIEAIKTSVIAAFKQRKALLKPAERAAFTLQKNAGRAFVVLRKIDVFNGFRAIFASIRRVFA